VKMWRDRKTGSIRSRRTTNGKRNLQGRDGELTLSFTVCFFFFWSTSSFPRLTSMILDDAHAARRKYKKDLDYIKPDLETYNKQKALAMGSGSLTAFNNFGSEMTVTSEEQRMAAENLYRDANTLIYGDSKPSEDAIDRVVGKINKEYVSFSIPKTLISRLNFPFHAASIRNPSSPGSATTMTKATSPISTSTTACSIRRYAIYLPFFFVFF